MRRAAAVLALAVAFPCAAQKPDPEKGRVTAEVHVGRILVDALVLDEKGVAIPDLKETDFAAKVAGKPATVEAAEWIPAAQPEAPPLTEDGQMNAQGRILLLFVQAPLGADRAVGLLRVWAAAKPLLASLVPSDRTAVLAWGGHMRIVQDFTSDVAKVKAALRAAILGGNVDDPGPDAPFPSLAGDLTDDVLESTETVERALAATGEALGNIGGAKAIIFVGWGIAVNHAPSEWDWAFRADEALRASRTSVFTLDSTDADFHTLEMGLQHLSAATGGLYAKTNVFPRQAIATVTNALAGRYVLVVVAPEGATSPIELTLVGRKGTVVAKDRD